MVPKVTVICRFNCNWDEAVFFTTMGFCTFYTKITYNRLMLNLLVNFYLNPNYGWRRRYLGNNDIYALGFGVLYLTSSLDNAYCLDGLFFFLDFWSNTSYGKGNLGPQNQLDMKNVIMDEKTSRTAPVVNYYIMLFAPPFFARGF